jgi:glycosyltransferase involved in cell wall biosynthesis
VSRRRIVVATGDVLGAQMAGPAIRAWQFAAALSAEHDVSLVTSAACTRAGDGRFDVRHVDDVRDLLDRTDVWVVQGSVLQNFPAIAASDAAVVVDLYDPYHLENLELSRERSHRDRMAVVHNATAVLNRAMRRGDFFLTASDKQRDFWIGALASLGRVNPLTYDADETLTSLIDLVPFGVDDTPPVHRKPALRGVLPGIGPDDKVLLWGGGLYNWFDPQTLVRAVDVVRRTRDDVRLVFLGGKHPNPAVPAMRVAAETRDLAGELGLTGRWVFFNEGWVPYDERADFLLESDIGVSTHLDHVETAFSFRTRILDYLWAGLPVVATGGDVFSDVIAAKGIGATVPPGDVDALAGTLLSLLEDDALRGRCAAASKELAQAYRWGAAVQPLLAFCRDPHRAPDLLDRIAKDNLARPFEPVRAPTSVPGWRGEVALAREYLERGGVGLLARRAATRAGKLLRGRTQ